MTATTAITTMTRDEIEDNGGFWMVARQYDSFLIPPGYYIMECSYANPHAPEPSASSDGPAPSSNTGTLVLATWCMAHDTTM